jgi:ribonuclease-3
VIPHFTTIKELFSRKGRKFFFSIKSLTGCYPRSVSVYKMAFIHKSAQQKGASGEVISNERLEFLGDAILGAVIASELYQMYPEKDEGALTKMRARIVNRNLLNQVGSKLNLEQLIQSQAQLDLSQTHVVGDAVEALIGAVYIDQGFACARRFILKSIIEQHVNFSEIVLNDSNFKSMLIEWGHKYRQSIVFKTEELATSGETPLVFLSKVYVNDELWGEGQGTSKKEAQQNSARIALERTVNK